MTQKSRINDQCVAHTKLGAIQGVQEGDVVAFHGVPYGIPPVGPRRFRGPGILERWNGVKDATRSAPASYQLNDSNRAKVLKIAQSLNLGTAGIHPRPDYADGTYGQQNISEDCLYLEMWVPKRSSDSSKKLPVYIYYHGGANASSSGANKNETGNNLAHEENIIVIRPSYRNGFLGWGHFGLISDLYPEAVNLGLQDQIASLRWVHEHIEAFGGDPDNITVAGESAGATAVSGLLSYPPVQPLIRRAIIQSLSPFHAWCTQEKPDAISMAELFLQLLEIDDPAKLAILDPDYFLVAHNLLTKLFHPDRNCAWSPVGPVVDGNFCPKHPGKYLSEEVYPRQDFELMMGFAKDEWQYSRGQSNTAQRGTEQEVKAVFTQVFGKEGANQLYQDYKALYPDHTPGHLLGDVMSMEFFKYVELAIARNFASHGFRTYVFQFSLDLPGYGGWLRAVHTADTPIIFRNLTDDVLARFPGYDGMDRTLLKQIATEFGKMYASFIRSGDAGNEWLTYTLNTTAIMWLAEKNVSKPHLLDGEWIAFEKGGIRNFRDLQHILVTNTRRALNKTRRVFAADNGLWSERD